MLVVVLIILFAGVVVDSLFSASWVLDDALLLTAAAVIAVVLLVTRGRGRGLARRRSDGVPYSCAIRRNPRRYHCREVLLRCGAVRLQYACSGPE